VVTQAQSLTVSVCWLAHMAESDIFFSNVFSLLIILCHIQQSAHIASLVLQLLSLSAGVLSGFQFPP